uniref:sensor histidine kinase n=1 Tax=Palleronia sp. TaxID=1940284 RepID=UPI0035C827FD
VLRIDDIKADARYGQSAPFNGMPPGHLPVTSYLSAPVISRSGEILGALIFGHDKPGVFTERSQRIVTAIASQAAIAIDNAGLYESIQRELVERQKFETHQDLLIQELNHRVKNMLSTVQSIATQTLRAHTEPEAMKGFQGRLLALSQSHSLIMRENWHEVDLREIAASALAPFLNAESADERARLEGPPVPLSPKVALALGMGFHELATNAVKYGALSAPQGLVEIRWREVDKDELCITWVEKNGPPVEPSDHRGFGNRLLKRGLAHELGGTVRIVHDPGGVICEIHMPLPEATP